MFQCGFWIVWFVYEGMPAGESFIMARQGLSPGGVASPEAPDVKPSETHG